MINFYKIGLMVTGIHDQFYEILFWVTSFFNLYFKKLNIGLVNFIINPSSKSMDWQLNIH